jgi:hypothetical protein
MLNEFKKRDSLHALDRFQSYKKDFQAKYENISNEVKKKCFPLF